MGWLGDLHDNTKWVDPIGHHSLNGAQKSSSATVRETSRGLGDLADSLGINSHFPRYWQGKADKDNNSFERWGGNTAGGVGAFFGAMYGLEGMGGTEGIGNWFSNLGTDSGLGYQDADGFVGNWEYGGKSPMWQPSTYNDMFSKMNSGGGGGQQGQAGAQAQGRFQPPNMGNPALTAALTKLVEQQEQTKRQQEAGPLSGAMGGLQQPYNVGLTPEDIQRLMASFQQQDGGGYAGSY
jgi:hypothetical protein